MVLLRRIKNTEDQRNFIKEQVGRLNAVDPLQIVTGPKHKLIGPDGDCFRRQ